MPLDFAILDVFVSKPAGFSGNQLALIPDGAGLDSAFMLDIAREFHFSETLFLTGKSKGGWSARVFTPEGEIPFAGHPSIGAAFYIRERVAKAPIPVALDLPVGRVLVLEDESGGGSDASAGNLLWLLHREPEFGEILDEKRVAALAACIGLSATHIDNRFPVQIVSTGLPHVILPVTTPEALRRAAPKPDAFADFFAGTEKVGLFAFAPLESAPTGSAPPGRGRVLSRMFAPHLGIAEDPATGSASGCLGAWLSEHRYFASRNVDIVSEQGASVNRPSIIHVKVEPDAKGFNVRAGGASRIVAEGRLET